MAACHHGVHLLPVVAAVVVAADADDDETKAS
jgi:hypothetical protein